MMRLVFPRIRFLLLVIPIASAAVWAAVPEQRMPGAIVDPMTDAFEWSAERRLTWADFHAPPDVRSSAAAMSAYVTSFDTECSGPVFVPRVVTRFLPKASWVKSQHLLHRDAANTLRHEQTHFDLSEVQARRALKELQELPSPCTLGNDDFDRLFKKFGQRDGDIQQQYDRETAHGTNYRRQNEWQSQVERWLVEMRR